MYTIEQYEVRAYHGNHTWICYL